MKIAMYQHTQHSCIRNIFEVNEYMENSQDHVRVSEIIEAEFPERQQGEVIAVKVKALDKILDELQNQIQQVLGQKQELLALTHE